MLLFAIYRTFTDRNMVVMIRLGYDINFNYFADMIAPMHVMLYCLSISNILLMITDLKIFNTEEYSFAVSQILTLDYEHILNHLDSYVDVIENIEKNKELSFMILVVTDIIENGSYIIFTKKAKKYLEIAFNINNIEQGY